MPEQVSHAWLVDPIGRKLEVLRLEHVFRDEERVRAESFDAIELELGILSADVAL